MACGCCDTCDATRLVSTDTRRAGVAAWQAYMRAICGVQANDAPRSEFSYMLNGVSRAGRARAIAHELFQLARSTLAGLIHRELL